MGIRIFLFIPILFTALISDAFRVNNLRTTHTIFQISSQRVATDSISSRTNVGSGSRSPQVLEFVEPTTNVTVKLVGAMHYNPVSIGRAEQVVEESLRSGRLSAVLIESCPSRWEKTMELRTAQGVKAALLRLIMRSEMSAASDKAALSAVPTVLADQEIELTKDRMGDTFKRTLKDILSPFSNGWNRLYGDLAEVAELALPSGPQYLGAKDFLDPSLLVSTPVTLLRYPLAFLIRAPITGAAVLGGISLLALLDPTSSNAAALFSTDASLVDRISDLGVSATTSFLEVALLSRMFVVTILHERNIVLAENILDQCRAAAAAEGEYKSRLSDNRILGSKSAQETSDSKENVVIAVLGMAHCNGVMKLLQEKHVK